MLLCERVYGRFAEKTLYSNLCKLKQKIDMEDRKDLVYLLPCGTCGDPYVGKTGKHYCDRKSQHQRKVKNKKTMNAFYSHIKSYKQEELEEKKIKEAVHINVLNPYESMVQQGILNLEKRYEFDKIWWKPGMSCQPRSRRRRRFCS